MKVAGVERYPLPRGRAKEDGREVVDYSAASVDVVSTRAFVNSCCCCVLEYYLGYEQCTETPGKAGLLGREFADRWGW